MKSAAAQLVEGAVTKSADTHRNKTIEVLRLDEARENGCILSPKTLSSSSTRWRLLLPWGEPGLWRPRSRCWASTAPSQAN